MIGTNKTGGPYRSIISLSIFYFVYEIYEVIFIDLQGVNE
jgi:hypothetical protein